MIFFVIFMILFIASPVCAYNAEQIYEFYTMRESKAMYEYRIDDFSKLFGDSLFGSDGLFIFHEHLGVQRLYIRYYGDGKEDFFAYQIPETGMQPWLHPEKYMDERSRLLNKRELIKRCNVLVPSGESFWKKIDSLHLDEHLFVCPRISHGQDMRHSIMGFSQKDGIRRYFYYVKYEDFWEQKESRFAVYAKVFDVMEQLNGKIALPECR